MEWKILEEAFDYKINNIICKDKAIEIDKLTIDNVRHIHKQIKCESIQKKEVMNKMLNELYRCFVQKIKLNIIFFVLCCVANFNSVIVILYLFCNFVLSTSQITETNLDIILHIMIDDEITKTRIRSLLTGFQQRMG